MEKLPDFGIVGNASEEDKAVVVDKIIEGFLKQGELLSDKKQKELKEAEYKKTEDQLSIIKSLNEETNKLMIESGVEPFDIPEKNIHFLKEKFLEKIGVNTDGSFDQKTQSILLSDELNSNFKFSLTLFHEMLHMKSKQIWEVSSDGDKIKKAPYRNGTTVYSTHKKESESKGFEHAHFNGLDEAIVTNLEKICLPIILNLPENKKYKDIYYSEEQVEERRKLANKYRIEEGDFYEINEDNSISFGYRNQRMVLDFLCEEIFKQHPEKYTDTEAVFKEFVRAHFTGHLIEIGRLIEDTFGKGSFRILGAMDSKNKNVSRNILEALQKNRRLFLAAKK